MSAAEIWNSVRFWRGATAVLATLSVALFVAATIARDPPSFSSRPIIAVIRDNEQHPIWAIRLACDAHEIAADSLRVERAPADHVYQLWLLVPNSVKPHQLGLLPQSGRKQIAVTPENTRLLTGAGELIVTLEPLGGSPQPAPSGPAAFRATLESSD
jgi:anti-sigma-K factor RskA